MKTSNQSKPFTKILLKISKSDSDIYQTESVWAEDLGSSRFRIDNSPFSVFGFSFNDVVIATLENGKLVATRVLLRGGHSTYRVRLAAGRTHLDFLQAWNIFEQLGCTFEGTGQPDFIYSIDVPPAVSVQQVYLQLEKFENAGFWHFEEAHYEPAPKLQS